MQNVAVNFGLFWGFKYLCPIRTNGQNVHFFYLNTYVPLMYICPRNDFLGLSQYVRIIVAICPLFSISALYVRKRALNVQKLPQIDLFLGVYLDTNNDFHSKSRPNFHEKKVWGSKIIIFEK